MSGLSTVQAARKNSYSDAAHLRPSRIVFALFTSSRSALVSFGGFGDCWDCWVGISSFGQLVLLFNFFLCDCESTSFNRRDVILKFFSRQFFKIVSAVIDSFVSDDQRNLAL